MDTDGGPLAEQRLNCSDYLSADVRQMLYGFSSVSDLFNIRGLYWSASGRGMGTAIVKNRTAIEGKICLCALVVV